MNYYCAWCGDEPDENGSHGICPTHAEEQWQKYLASKSEQTDEPTNKQDEVVIVA